MNYTYLTERCYYYYFYY